MIWIRMGKYTSWRAETVVIEVREEDALSNVLKTVGEDDEVEELRVAFEGDYFHESALFQHELTVLGSPNAEIRVV